MSKEDFDQIIRIDNNLTFLSDQIQGRIYHPTVRLFFEKYLELGLHNKTIEILSGVSSDAQIALVETLRTHVHKEKPVFISLLGNQLGVEADQTTSIATAVDLLWAISLIYDDMFDSDYVRSGVQTVWATYGKEKAVAICYEVFEAVMTDLHQNVGVEIASLAQDYVQKGLNSLGEHTHFSLQASTEELYQNYHNRNDFNGVFGVRALLNVARNRDPKMDETAIVFIRNLNLASQLLNDLKDIDDFYDRGYSDIRNGVVTVPILCLYTALSDEEKQTFLELFGSKHGLTTLEQQFVVRMVKKYDAVSSTVRRIFDHYTEAEEIAKKIFSPDTFDLIQSWIIYKQEPLQRYV